jgi:hypothetical protein
MCSPLRAKMAAMLAWTWSSSSRKTCATTEDPRTVGPAVLHTHSTSSDLRSHPCLITAAGSRVFKSRLITSVAVCLTPWLTQLSLLSSATFDTLLSSTSLNASYRRWGTGALVRATAHISTNATTTIKQSSFHCACEMSLKQQQLTSS